MALLPARRERVALSERNRRFLARQQAKERPVPHRALTAAGVPIDLRSKTEARKLRVLRQGWQLDAAGFVDAIPHLSFAYRFIGHAASRMRWFPAMVNPEEPDGPPVPIADIPGVPQGVIDACAGAMAALGVGRMAISGLQRQLAWNFGVSGECFLVGTQNGQEADWKVRSIEEFMVFDDIYKIRSVPIDPQGVLGWTDVDPDKTFAARMHVPHWRFQDVATSPMRALLDTSEAWLLLSKDIRATARSRLAGSGILKIPEGLRMESLLEDNGDPESEEWFGRFAEALVTPLVSEGDAQAVVPIGISGDPEALAQLDHLILDRPYSALAIELRAELIGDMATGLDIPREILEGTTDVSHWGQWLISDETFRFHLEPGTIEQVDSFTTAFLRPYLIAAGVADYWVQRACIWYDPVDLISKPDPMANAVLLHDRYALSNKALLKAGGFAETDQPGPLEVEFRMLQKTRTFPPNMVEAIFHAVDPSLKFPPINTSGTVPGIGPEGEIAAEPLAPTPVAPPALDGTGPTPAQTGPPPEAAPMPAATASRDLGAWAARSERTVASARLSRRLTEIDAQVRGRLQVAASAAVLRLLDKAGAKVRTRAADRKFAAAGVDLTTVRDVDNRALPAVLGEPVVASLGFADHHALLQPDWGDLHAQFVSSVTGAHRQALRVACQLAHLAPTDPRVKRAETALANAVGPAWLAFETALGQLAERLLYHPEPDPKVPTVDPFTVVPAGLVRRALSIAGGGKVGPITAAGQSEVLDPGQTTNVTTGPLAVGVDPPPAMASVDIAGQIGGGSAITDLLGSADMQVIGYTWEHGGSANPFEPHEDLDGASFSSWTADVLANEGDWPENQFYFPGDHVGCVCDFSTQWMTSDDVAAATDESSGLNLSDLLKIGAGLLVGGALASGSEDGSGSDEGDEREDEDEQASGPGVGPLLPGAAAKRKKKP